MIRHTKQVTKPLVEDEKADASDDAAATESGFKVFSRDTVSATIGKELGRSAVLSAVIAILLMLVYISFRFEFWSGIASITALTHDVLMVLSIYAIFNLLSIQRLSRLSLQSWVIQSTRQSLYSTESEKTTDLAKKTPLRRNC